MDLQTIKWLPNDVHQGVFFTRKAFEKYSLRNRLEEVIQEKEKELFPEGRVISRPKPDAELSDQTPGPSEHDAEDRGHEEEVKASPLPDQPMDTEAKDQVSKRERLPSTEKDRNNQHGSLHLDHAGIPKKHNDEASSPSEPVKTPIWVLPAKEPEEEVLTKQQVMQRVNERQGSRYTKLLYPRPSWLTMEEQRLYMEYLMKKQRGQKVPQEGKEMQRLKEIQHKVLAEQDEFQAYSEESANAYPEKYQTMDRDAEQYLDAYVSSLCKRATNYPQYYVQQDSVPICPPKVPTFIPFIHIKCLLKVGDVPKLIIPNIESYPRPRISADAERVSERYPPLSDPNKRPTCSGDANMEKLAEKYAAEVAISSAGLKCLLDPGTNYERQWELPVVVKEHVIRDVRGERKHKVVYIDKPFPQRAMLGCSKNAWFYKFSTKVHLLHPHHPSNISYSSHRQHQITPLQDDPDDLFTDLTDLETFGTSSGGASSAFKKYVREPKPVVKVDLEEKGKEEEERMEEGDGESGKGGPLYRSGSEGFNVNHGAGSGDLIHAVMSPVTSPQPDKMKDKPKLVESIPLNNGSSMEEASAVDENVGKDGKSEDTTNSEMAMGTSTDVHESQTNTEECAIIPCNKNNDTSDALELATNEKHSEISSSGTIETKVKGSHSLGNASNDSVKELADPERSLDTSTDDERLEIDIAEDEKGMAEEKTTKGLGIRTRRRTRSSSSQSMVGKVDEVKDVAGRRRTRSQVHKVGTQSPVPNISGEGIAQDVPESQGRIETKGFAESAKTTGGTESEGTVPVKRGRGRPRKIKKESNTESTEKSKECPSVKRVTRSSIESEDSRLGKRRSARLASHGQEDDLDEEEIESKRKRCSDTSAVQASEEIHGEASGNATSEMSSSLPIPDHIPPHGNPPLLSESRPLLSGPKVIPLSPDKPGHKVEASVVVNPKPAPFTKLQEKKTGHQAKATQRQGSTEGSSGFTFDRVMAAQKQMLTHQAAPVQREDQPVAPVPAMVAGKSTFPKSDPNAWKPSEDAGQYQIYDQPNLTYNLWLLGNTRLLIRCGIHGFYKGGKRKPTTEMSLAAKMEHQPYFGIEQPTYSDSARAWVDTHIKNVQKVARVRINAYNSEIVHIEHLGIGDIFNAKSHFNPLSAMSAVNGILEKLKSLPEGHYLLGHSPGNLHAHIKKSVSTTRGVYDLHKAYLGRQVAMIRNERIAWMPIDTNTLLFYHKKHNRVPATFEAKDSRKVASATAGQRANKPNKKKNKGKKNKNKK